MCGLCGEVRHDAIPASVAAVERMSRVLAPRGPDDSGAYAQGPVAVAHRRLAVIDPSPRARQPMVDLELRLGIVYNGAVYNHRELRRELEGLGYRFFSAADTEVVLKAYHAWGDRFPERLNGIFALALWEMDGGRLVLARDRLGVKPLYTAAIPGGLRFASSLPALLAAGGVDTEIDPIALHNYLSLNAAIPAPRTLLKGIRKVAPATLLKVEPDGTVGRLRYWRLPEASSSARTEIAARDWRDATLSALRRAVRRQLTADVPVGALLSGGLDSSLIVGLMAEAGTGTPETFSIGFHRVGGLRGHEFRYSDLVARRFDTEHHKLLVDPPELLDHLEACVAAMSEPKVNRDAIGFYLLGREASRQLRVVLTGQGADELFAGYSWHASVAAAGGGAESYLRAGFDRDHAGVLAILHPRFAGDDHSGRRVAAELAARETEDPLAQIFSYETTVQLAEDPLQRVDNMTMAWGVEARVPFLDHELVELAARTPSRLKLAGGGKGILKQAARSILPAEIVERSKGHFPVPTLQSIRGSCLEFVRYVLRSPRARQRRLFRQGYVDRLLAAPAQHRDSKRLWEAAVLECWLQVHGL